MRTFWGGVSNRRTLYFTSGVLLCIFALWLAIEFVFINRQVNTITETERLRATQGETENLAHWLIWTDDKASYAILATTPAGVDHFVGNYEQGMQTLHAILKRLDAADLEPQDRTLLGDFKTWLARYDTETRKSFEAKRNGNEMEARRLAIATPTEYGDGIADRLTLDLHERLDTASSFMIADAQTTKLITVIAGFVAIVLGLLTSALMIEILTLHGDKR